jgi:hypothetical protein
MAPGMSQIPGAVKNVRLRICSCEQFVIEQLDVGCANAFAALTGWLSQAPCAASIDSSQLIAY